MFNYKKVLYAVDVNDEGLQRRLANIVEHTKKKQATLYIVTVHKTIFDYGYAAGISEQTPNEMVKKKVKEKFQELTKSYEHEPHVKIELIEADGIAEGIIEYVENESVEQLIINGHHHGLLGRMGSVATKLVNNAPCDVVVLKHV
ncbi:universal stress protein [Facilibium subflavum]|uniref:universal stress protein n=1 Tax=Facilibium subflavum TaxID=2219058 RepID=UPI000E65CD7A|nr:universal stress protein [Facilibium subflavum]